MSIELLTDISYMPINDVSPDNNIISDNIVSTNQADNTSNSSKSSKVSSNSEELLAQFSTRIYSTDSARQNNLRNNF